MKYIRIGLYTLNFIGLKVTIKYEYLLRLNIFFTRTFNLILLTYLVS